MAYEPPLKITIPTPNEFPMGHGTNSTGKRGGNLRIRCTNKEYDAVQLEAIKLGVTLAMFCRWCCVYAATRLKDHRESNSNSVSIGEHDGEHPIDKRVARKRKK